MKKKKSKLLVTGAAGFIGSEFVRQAVGRGYKVTVVDSMTYAADLVRLGSVKGKYSFYKADICDRNKLKLIFKKVKPDIVVHLAAESHVDRSITGPAEFIQTNIVGTYVLLEACRDYFSSLDGGDRERFRFHHVSTDEVYGDLEADAPEFTEATP